jgi:hypothetical protein
MYPLHQQSFVIQNEKEKEWNMKGRLIPRAVIWKRIKFNSEDIKLMLNLNIGTKGYRKARDEIYEMHSIIQLIRS